MAIANAADSAFTGLHSRRYDLDWLRAFAFSLLIFYHIGMFYVTWDFHVKSVYAGHGPEPFMLLINPWRLALLFFISGAAVRFSADKAPSLWRFAGSRTLRLGLPILAGMIVVVAPQSYYQLRQAGLIEPGYLPFWGNYLKLDQLYPMITPTWNHLWYVVYLLVYILLITPVLPLLKRLADDERWLGALTGGPARLLLVVIIPFVAYEFFLNPHFPTTHDLVNDWADHAHRFTIFMLGYFAAKNGRFWRAVDRALPASAALALLLGGLGFYINTHGAAVAASPVARIPHIEDVHTVLHTLYSWSCIVMLLGVGQRWLNRPSKAVAYFTGAVFCYYILHQTIIIAAGYYLTQMRLGAWPEFLLITAITIVGCAAGYELLRSLPGVRPFFGIKAKKTQASSMQSAPAAA